ncbi:MAG: DUF167 domain-containing protein [Desulfobulbaceae bacterium]|jgi:uncharacterized protein (TIGR00251 family)|nr:DUF167 domain-containing protein [Desulfobulbaceae bacterium]MDY0350678.1 DUF167 domain-containing protein [Desulfobulbaceae bacterium]
MPYLQTLPDGALLLRLQVQPRASRTELAGLHDNALKLRLTTPPIEGRANKAVIDFLAKRLRLPKKAFTIKSGLHSREKLVLIRGCTEEAVHQLVAGGEHEAPPGK